MCRTHLSPTLAASSGVSLRMTSDLFRYTQFTHLQLDAHPTSACTRTQQQNSLFCRWKKARASPLTWSTSVPCKCLFTLMWDLNTFMKTQQTSIALCRMFSCSELLRQLEHLQPLHVAPLAKQRQKLREIKNTHTNTNIHPNHPNVNIKRTAEGNSVRLSQFEAVGFGAAAASAFSPQIHGGVTEQIRGRWHHA